MTLDQYLSLPDKTAAKLAEAAGTTGATITRLLYGDAQPSADMVRAIVKATDGAVTADDLLFGEPRPKPDKVASLDELAEAAARKADAGPASSEQAA